MPNNQQTALVTGVSSGIGFAIATELLQQGYQVFGSVRKLSDADQLVSLSDSFVPLVFDVTDTTALRSAVQELEKKLDGRSLNALINNAGIGLSGPLMHQPMEEIRRSFEVNVFALLNVTRSVLPLLGACDGFKHKPGRIINIGSISGGLTVPFTGTYSATKHAVEALAQGFRRELTPYGIEVCTIEPGMIRSNLQAADKAGTAGNQYAETIYKDSWPQFNRSIEEQMENAKPADIVSKAVIKVLNASKPRPRNPLDPLWYIAKILPDRLFDTLIFNALKIKTMMTKRSFNKENNL